MTKNRRLFTGTFREKTQDYVIQVSLIILSLFIAIGADRCNTANKQSDKLQEYYAAIASDLVAEEAINKRHLGDCQKDIEGLEQALQLFRQDQDDSLRMGLILLNGVENRGSSRTFSPTTFDIMSSTGDALLIKDLDIRNDLYETFSFRSIILQRDLLAYEDQATATMETIGKFIDFTCLTQSQIMVDCLIDRSAFVQDAHNELVILRRQAEIRAFHITLAIQQNQKVQQTVNGLIKQ